jgi:LacI family transcriptional regulator
MADKKQNKVDIFAVAKRAKVSISTVSRSFNHPELVNPATRKKIDTAVRKLGYIRNRAAQTMHGIRSGTIGLVVPTIDHAIFAEVIQAFSDSVDAHGFTVMIASHGYDLEREYAALRKFLEHRVDGLALIGEDHSEETYELIERQNIPTVTMWNYSEISRLSCIGADNKLAGTLAAQHLVDLGHREIGLLFPPTKDNDRARDRRSGVQRVLSDADINVDLQRDIESTYSITDAKAAALLILRSVHRPSAMLCGNDVLAMGVIYAARACNLNIPQDLSVIGIGDFRGSSEAEPGLTTVRLPAREIGRLAGKHLSRSIVGDLTKEQRVGCDIALIERGTCKAQPSVSL